MTVIMRISHGSRGDHTKGSDLPAPQVIRDELDYMWSPIDGKPQTSKRSYYKQVRAAGCEINPAPVMKETNRPEFKSDGLVDDIKRAIATTS